MTAAIIILAILPERLYAVRSHGHAVSFVSDTLSRENIKANDDIRTDSIRELVVTAKNITSPTRHSTPIQVLTRKDIEKLGVQGLSEAVRTLSGVNIRDYGGIGGIKTVSVRSMGSSHTAVSYDGISLSNVQSGQIDIGRFNLDNIEQIDLSIGQTDNIFQSARMFASAGALSIQTAKPDFSTSPVHVGIQMKAGSFGTYNPSAIYQQKLGKGWWLSMNGDYLYSKGDYPYILRNGSETSRKIRKNSDISSGQIELNLFGDMGKGGRLNMKANYYDSERGLPGSVILYNDEANERLWDRAAFAQMQYENSLTPKWDIRAQAKYNYAWTHYHNEGSSQAFGIQDDYYTQQEYYLSAGTLYKPFEFLRFSIVEDFFVNTLVSNIPEFAYPVRYSSLTALSGQFENSRLTATASVLATYITEDVRYGEAAPDRFRLSPAASISFKITEDQNFRIRASYKDGFRVPTFNDLYYARVGNRNIKPEKATQFNLGLTWSGSIPGGVIDYASFSADAYYNLVKDKIVAIPTMFIWKMMNMGKVDIYGTDINAQINFRLTDKMSMELGGNYTYQKAIDLSDPEAKNYRHQIPYAPEHSGNIIFSFLNPYIDITYMLNAIGDRYSMSQNIPSNLIEGYIDQNISLSHTFTIKNTKLKLQAECLNIGNVQYEVIKYYPMAGRSFRITLKFTY